MHDDVVLIKIVWQKRRDKEEWGGWGGEESSCGGQLLFEKEWEKKPTLGGRILKEVPGYSK